MYGVRASIAATAFESHAIQFLSEIDAERADNLTCAEVMAWPAICERAAKAGIHGG